VPSSLPRVSTVVERPLYNTLARLARKDGGTVAQKARDLLRDALELIEEAGLEAIVENRVRNRAPSIGHEELKRRLKVR